MGNKTIITHFSDREMDCRCGCGKTVAPELLLRLEAMRELLSRPLPVNSGARCVAYNRQMKGEPNSLHLQGLAVDLACSDIDLTNEVEVKKLLIELYDWNLISKNTIQTKMDLNPDVEKSNRKKEGTLVDMSWDIKDIVALVQMGVMSVETAREMLGLEEAKETGRVKTDETKEAEGMYVTATINALCDECAFLDGEGNRCQVTGEERRFNQKACRQFRKPEIEGVA